MHVPNPKPDDPRIWVSREVRLTSKRIPFDADELIRTRLSNRSWQLYRVPANQIEPINSDWVQILSAPGIHVAGKSYGTYRVAIDDSYLPWLSVSKFKFQPDINPLNPVAEEVLEHGEWVAERNVISRFLKDAMEAVSSGKSPGLDSCYRKLALPSHLLPLEWAILKRDLKPVKTRFTQLLLFIILNLFDDYDTPLVLELLEKDEEQLLQPLWDLHTDLSAYLPSESANFKARDAISKAAQYRAEFPRVSLFRLLVESAGGKTDVRQHGLDPSYLANDNHNLYGSVLRISGSKRFGTFDSQKMLGALSKSPVFHGVTIHEPDVMKWSATLMSQLPIGFPDGYLGLPSDVLSKISYVQVQMIRAQILDFYHGRRSLDKPKNHVLVLLTCNPIRHLIEGVLVEWTASVDGLRLFERLIKDIQVSQPKEQLLLTLAALLCYQRLFPLTPDTNQPIKGSYQADFDAILNGERLSNARTVFEYMVLSVLRVFHTVEDNEKMRTFLACVLNIEWPLDPSHKFSGQYWTCRMKDGLSHKDAHKTAEKLVGPARSGEEKTVVGEEAMVEEMAEEMATLEEQESGVTTDKRGVLVKTQREEDYFASPWVSNHEHRVPAFPNAVFHLGAYKLVCVCLPNVPPRKEILCTISLPNGSSVVIVLGSYVSTLERDLDTKCWEYNVEPSREDVELLGFVEAQNQKVEALAKMAVGAILRDNTLEKGLWICVDPLRVSNLFTTWLREVVERSGIENDPESGRSQLDGYEFNSYTLVRVSGLGRWAETLDKLGNFDEILSIEELQDGLSWELPVCRSYLPKLEDKLREMVPDCIIEPDYDPTEPNANDVEEFGYEKARILRSFTFRNRVERMIREALPKAVAFYGDFAMGGGREMVILDNDEEMDMLGNEEQEDEEMVILENEEQEEVEMVESTDECWVMVQALRL